MKKAIILGAILVVIGGVIWLTKGSEGEVPGITEAKYTEPADAVSDFYDKWLEAAKNATAQPSMAALAKSSVLTKELSTRISADLQTEDALDPVLCQTTVPQDIVLRNVYEQTDKAQMLVTSKDKSVTKQAVVTLTKTSDSWVISEIECNNGEIAPVREFSFDKEGFLIKNSIPKPFNNKNWHIVFMQDGKAGNVAPLFFDAKSQCTNLEGVKAVCKPDTLSEAAKVHVYGEMTERGVTVSRLEFVK
jgi:hypothetical protein